MTIPLAYNLRNLIMRKTTTLMTALGVALTVAVLLAILALINGLRVTLSASGNPLHVMVMRKGSTSEMVSNFMRAQFPELKFKPGIATGRDGQPLVSLEIVSALNLANVDNPIGVNVLVRGLSPAGQEIRRATRLTAGRWFDTGRNELVAGASVAKRFPDARLGGKLHIGRRQWVVVGVMDSGRGVWDSEIWGDVNRVAEDLERVEDLSSALVEATDAVTARALVNNIENDQRLGMMAVTEEEYYSQQTSQAAPIVFVGIFVSIIMAVGSSLAAMNTMYAAVARRAREIGTLRVLGFSRGNILISFLFESAIVAGLGGLLGCLLVTPLNGLTTAVGSKDFSELAFDFRMTPRLILTAIAFAVSLGAVGGLLPARAASRKEILTALREI
jgi:putative ABC transport system permease protein